MSAKYNVALLQYLQTAAPISLSPRPENASVVLTGHLHTFPKNLRLLHSFISHSSLFFEDGCVSREPSELRQRQLCDAVVLKQAMKWTPELSPGFIHLSSVS